jgi:sugar/nucleoside kinase (ribokinase family)
MSRLKPVGGGGYDYPYVVGTGGIGSGMVFQLEGNQTLGRNESRAAALLPNKDYCKQHIILHYIAVLLGAGKPDGMPVVPIGKVGADGPGEALLGEMASAGMRMEHVHKLADASTLFSVCFQYPDSAGGNITTSNNASALVAPSDIDEFFAQPTVALHGGLTLAAPEVPLPTRLRILEQGRRYGAFNAASLLTSEAESFERAGGYAMTDLVSVNIDEAAAIAGTGSENGRTAMEIATRCAESLIARQASIRIVVTDGPNGSYAYSEGGLTFTPPLPAKNASTAGAGDAFFAGTLVGLCCGLPFRKPRSDTRFGETPLRSAVELGTLLASLSVTSPDTIHREADAEALLAYARRHDLPFSPEFDALFHLNS